MGVGWGGGVYNWMYSFVYREGGVKSGGGAYNKLEVYGPLLAS